MSAVGLSALFALRLDVGGQTGLLVFWLMVYWGLCLWIDTRWYQHKAARHAA